MHDRGVITRLQRCNDCRLAWLSWSVPTVLDRANLIAGDDPADYRGLPVIIRSNQRPCAIVQFQGGISQCIGNAKWRELGPNSAHNNCLWSTPFNDESTNHHVDAGLR